MIQTSKMTDLSTSQPISPPTYLSTNPFIYQPTISQPTNLSTNPFIHQPTNLSTNQLINQSIHPSTSQLIYQQTHLSTNPFMNQSTNHAKSIRTESRALDGNKEKEKGKKLKPVRKHKNTGWCFGHHDQLREQPASRDWTSLLQSMTYLEEEEEEEEEE